MYNMTTMALHVWEAVMLSNRTPFGENKRFWVKQSIGNALNRALRHLNGEA